MSFPFLFLALSMAGGILLAATAKPPLLPAAILLLFSLLLSWTFQIRRKTKTSIVFILLTSLLIGSNLYLVSNARFEKNSLFHFQAASYVDFYGTLYRSVSPGKNSDILFMNVKTVTHQNRTEKMRGRLRVTVARSTLHSNPLRLFVGDTVQVSAQLTSSKGYRNFNPSFLEKWQKIRGVHQRAFSKTPLLVQKVASGPKLSPLRQISILRHFLTRKIEEFFSVSGEAPSLSFQGAVLEALLLGERGRMDEKLSTALQDSGLYHLFAISGAHIALISLLLFFFFRIMRIPTRPSYAILIFLLIFYAFLVEGRPSIFRATIMTLFFLLGKLLWRETSLLNTVSFSAFALLFINPFSLFDAGFQLTFSATLAIILFYPRVIKLLPKLPLRASEILALSISAQLGVLPMTAWVFNRITFSSLLLNLAALPLVAFIMLAGYLFLPLAFISAALSNWMADTLKFAIDGLVTLSHIPGWASFISYRIPTPHLATAGGYYLFFFLLLLPLKKKKWKWPLRSAFLFFFALLVTHPFPPVSKDFKVTFVDVGQGDCLLVEFPGKKKMLIDGGGIPSDGFDVGERVVSPFLWRKGIKTIEFMVLTHAHPDHLNGLLSIAQNFRIKQFWESLSPVENNSYNQLQQILEPSTERRRMFRNQTFSVDGVTIDILHPQEQEPRVHSIDNDQSMVIRLSYGQTSFLLTADIGAMAERDIIASEQQINSDVLKSPHHGSDSSSTPEFLEKVGPRFTVISVGERNAYGLPHPEVIDRYINSEAKIYRTDCHGAIEISSNGKALKIRTTLDHLK